MAGWCACARSRRSASTASWRGRASPCCRTSPRKPRALRRACSAPDLVHLDAAHALERQTRALLGVAVGAAPPDAAHQLEQLVVRGAGPQRALQVAAAGGEQAGHERALGGEPRARTVAAEGLRDGGDHADLAGAVAIAPA